MPSVNHRSYRADSPKSDGAFGAPAWVPLLPWSVVAFGAPAQPVESLMTLQSGVNRLLRLLTSFELPRRRPFFRRLLALRPR